ncbi:hypothetical protein N9L92_03800, partial [Saprospiraceae bacterium]|nr:hypothetical protein [Saprospiraceae bacterium]
FDILYERSILNPIGDAYTQLMIDYLKCIRDLMSNQLTQNYVDRISKVLYGKNIFTNWNSDIIEVWATLNPTIYQNEIFKMNRLIEPYLDDVYVPQ